MKRIARRAAYAAAGLVAVMVLAALVLPEFLDSSGIEADLQRSLSQAVGGEIKWERLQIRLLPTPHGVLRRLQAKLPATSASAEQVEATLALLPLLRGHAEIASVKLLRPEIRIEIAPAAGDEETVATKEDAGQTYRRIMGEVARALREFAPDTVVEIRNGVAEIRLPEARRFALRDLSAQARSGPEGLKLQVDTASDYWQRLRLSASVAPDLSANASVEVVGLKATASALPAASLLAKARTDATTSVELTLEEARRGGTTIGPGEVRYSFKDEALAASVVFDIDAAQAIVSARAAALPLGGVESARGHVSGRASASASGASWKAELQILKSSLLVDGWRLPAPVALASGSMTIDGNRMRFEQVKLSLAGSQATISATLAGYRASSLAVDASAAIDLDLAEAFKAAAPLAAQAGIEGAGGHISAQATASGRGADWKAGLRILQSNASLRGWRLPAPLGLAGGSATLAAQRVAFKEVALSAGEGRATVSGTYDLPAAAIDGRIESPGIVVDALIPKRDEKNKPPPEKKSPWPLPLTGRIALRSDFIRYQRHNFAPVSALLTLQNDSARLEIKEAALCGISLPLTLEAREEGLSASALITARRQQVADSASCLTEERVQMSGEFDLRAEMRAKGRARDLVRNLEGTLTAEARNGQLTKFALIGNIQKTVGLSGGGGLPYRTIAAKGHFQDGRFVVDETSLQSPIMGLAGNGWIQLGDYQSRLTILVAPFASLDKVVRAVPLIGYVIGGAVTSIPVGVSGDIRDPLVVPLGPGAITSELKGIVERTIKLPSQLLPEESGKKR